MVRWSCREARHLYQRGLAIRQRLHDAEPDNADYARDLSLTFDALGALAVQERDLPEARRCYEASLGLARRLTASAPEDETLLTDLVVSIQQVRDLMDEAGEDVTALAEELAEAMARLEALQGTTDGDDEGHDEDGGDQEGRGEEGEGEGPAL